MGPPTQKKPSRSKTGRGEISTLCRGTRRCVRHVQIYPCGDQPLAQVIDDAKKTGKTTPGVNAFFPAVTGTTSRSVGQSRTPAV